MVSTNFETRITTLVTLRGSVKMLRATKKLIRRLFFTNMKKAKNQRRLVIIVALIGVYYLGKHSSSLNLRASESGEKRILRDPPFRSTKSVVPRRSGKQQPKLRPSLYFGDLLKSGRNSNDNLKILQKRPSDGVHRAEQMVVKSTELAYRSQGGKSVASKPEEVTPPFAAGQTDQQVKNSKQTVQNRNKSIEQLKGTSQIQIGSRNSDAANQLAPIQTDVSPTPNANQVNLADKITDSKSKSKPTPQASSLSEQTTKPTASQTVSTEGSTAGTSEFAATNTTTAQSKIANPDEVNRHLQNLLKDKKIFGFADKNITERLQSMDILRTESYSKFLKYQISKRTELPNSQNNGDFYKYGFSKATSDKIPLLRSLPDNRDPR